jgi:stalled ribosome alternative rescue factor ArfA
MLTTTTATKPRAANQRWTKEACIAEARKHNTVTEWHNKGAGSYRKAKQKAKDGWLSKCTAHMSTPVRDKKPYKWTFEKCYEASKKYSRKVDFLEGDPSAYRAAERYGWMEDCTDGMEKRTYWTEATCLKEASSHPNISKWIENGKGSYRFAKAHSEDFYQKCCGKIKS